VNITLANVNDAPVIGGVDTGSVTEDVPLAASGALTISDPDPAESNFIADAIAGGYGTLIIDADGNWDYVVDNSKAAVQQLDAGESAADVLTVTTVDGSTHNVTVTIHGSEDVAVISGDTAGTVSEDGSLTASGSLAISDVDTADNPIDFPDEASTLGDSGYGSFQLSGGAWSYTLNNAHPSVQGLDAGVSLSDSHTFVASDGSTQVVTVVIQGTGEAAPDPVFEPLPPAPLPEPRPEPVEATEPPPAYEAPAEPDPVIDETEETGRTDTTAAEHLAGLPPTPNTLLGEPLQPDEIFLSVINDIRPERSGVQNSPLAADKPTVETAQTFLQELKAFWVDDNTTATMDMSEVRLSQEFWDDVDQMGQDMEDSVEEQEQKMQLSAEAAAGVGISLTAGFVSWVLRAGSMAASFLAAMPTWRHFDPMPVLSENKSRQLKPGEGEEDEDPDTRQTDRIVEDLFDR
jgi:VCBS repeat-containing protein